MGAYAEYAVAPVSRLIAIPEGISTRQAAAAMLQGMTAHYLAHSTYAIQRGDDVLIHAGAGGVGLLLIQMAKHLGARVLTTVSTDEKAALAQRGRRGRDHPLHPRRLRGEGARADRRPGRAGGLRLGGQDHLRRQPGLPASARA